MIGNNSIMTAAGNEGMEVSIIQFNAEPMSKKQRWLLHTLTRLNTCDWKLSFAEAEEFIDRVNSGERIIQLVVEYVGA